MHNSAKKIIKQFHDNQEIYRSLKHDIDDIFTRIIDTNHFRISNMAIRIKSEDALMKKSHTKTDIRILMRLQMLWLVVLLLCLKMMLIVFMNV